MRILFCDQTFPAASERLIKLLPDHELIMCSQAEIAQHVAKVDVVIPLMARLDASLMEEGNFSLIHQFGVGLEGVDIDAATRAGVWVCRVPSIESGNAASVAENALLLMLALSRQLTKARASLDAGLLGQPLGTALLHKTACIVGLGGVGIAVAERLRACGMRLLGVHEYPERSVPAEAGLDKVFALPDMLEAVAQADYVVLCLNYDLSRHNLVSHAELAAMKPGAYVINVARGGLLDPNALLQALESGQLAGAGLDVFWEEPVDPAHPIFAQNVVATPHIAGVTDASYDGTARTMAENISRYDQGETPRFAANQPR